MRLKSVLESSIKAPTLASCHYVPGARLLTTSAFPFSFFEILTEGAAINLELKLQVAPLNRHPICSNSNSNSDEPIRETGRDFRTVLQMAAAIAAEGQELVIQIRMLEEVLVEAGMDKVEAQVMVLG